jgi:acyl-CoA thioesterase FadM
VNFEPTSLVVPVRPNDLDSLGHVNNAIVLEYLEAGRWAWLAHHRLKRTGRVLPVVSRLEIDYRREILPPEVVVATRLEVDEAFLDPEAMSYRAIFHQTVIAAGAAEPAAEAIVKVAFIDAAARSLRTIQDFLQQTLEP